VGAPTLVLGRAVALLFDREGNIAVMAAPLIETALVG
jgi:hypothetical protein